MDRPFPASARPAFILLALLLTVACTGSTAIAITPAPPPITDPGNGRTEPGGGGGNVANPGQTEPGVIAPDQPVDGGPGGPGPVDPVDPEGQWQTIQPRQGLENLHAQGWDHVSLSPDGRSLTVYWWGGVEGCYGLSEVRVARDAAGVASVTLITGTPPAMGDFACIDLAVAYKTTVQLDQPLIIDGSGAGSGRE